MRLSVGRRFIPLPLVGIMELLHSRRIHTGLILMPVCLANRSEATVHFWVCKVGRGRGRRTVCSSATPFAGTAWRVGTGTGTVGMIWRFWIYWTGKWERSVVTLLNAMSLAAIEPFGCRMPLLQKYFTEKAKSQRATLPSAPPGVAVEHPIDVAKREGWV